MGQIPPFARVAEITAIVSHVASILQHCKSYNWYTVMDSKYHVNIFQMKMRSFSLMWLIVNTQPLKTCLYLFSNMLDSHGLIAELGKTLVPFPPCPKWLASPWSHYLVGIGMCKMNKAVKS
jgi:hypothetical protein